MLKKIVKFYNLIFGVKSSDVSETDLGCFMALIPSMRASLLKDQIRAVAEQRRGLSERFILALTSLAKENHWTEDESAKIRIYADYFSDRTASAYERIVKNKYYESDFDLFVVACLSLYLNDDFDGAYAMLVQRDPESPEFQRDWNFMSFAGYIIFSAGKDIKEAVRYFNIAEKQGVDTVSFATNAYVVYFEAGELEAANRIRQLIHMKYSKEPQALHALSYVELAKGYYPEGFRLAEARYEHPDASRHFDTSLLTKQRWQGEDLAGCSILVHGEQGLGDTIMCARYLPLLREMAGAVILEAQEAAIALLAPNFPDITMLSIEGKRSPELNFDYWIGAMSLPSLLQTSRYAVPLTEGYLKSPEEHHSYWQDRVQHMMAVSSLKVGVAWSGNPRHRSDRRRSIPFAAIASYLASVRNAVTWVSLQINVPENAPDCLISLVDEMPTLADTAALIEQMDLVITVDTSIVHIAGALGKRTWLLLPFRYEWRWGLDGETNPWYDSVEVIRQRDHGDWKGVLDDVFLSRIPNLISSSDARL